LLGVDRHVDDLGVEAQDLHDAVAFGEEIPIAVHGAEQPAQSLLHGRIHLAGKAEIAAPLEEPAGGEDELRGLLSIAGV
jgi:hypothetical protein